MGWILSLTIIIGMGWFLWYRHRVIIKKQLERSLKMVPLEIRVPPATKEEKEKAEAMNSVIAKAENIFASIHGIYRTRMKDVLTGAKHVSLEIIGDGRHLKIYVVVPISLLNSVQKAILGVYPEAEIQEVEEHNIFSEDSSPADIAGGVLRLKKSGVYPIKTYKTLDSDVLQSITTALTKLNEGEGAAVQILLRPAKSSWVGQANRYIRRIRQGRRPASGFADLVSQAFRMVSDVSRSNKPGEMKKDYQLTPQDEEMIKGLSEKSSKPGFQVAVRLLASSKDHFRAESVVEDIKASFSILNHPLLNGFDMRTYRNTKDLATDFIFRFFPYRRYMLLNSEELATIFHLQQLVETPHLAEAPSKKAPAPAELPAEGLVIGKNVFRGDSREVRLAPEDMRRHAYILGQTGTGKSTMLTNLILQDIGQGGGVCVVDPHGDLVENILGQIPRERADDVIYFDPGDLDRPMGLNLFEFKIAEHKDFVIQETINMLYKLYDPGHTGIIGPRYEHWFRNAALTLMADPGGASFIEVPKVFTDNDYLRRKLGHVDDSTVLDFWTKEMAQTSDFHKSEVLGWFVSKFGAFMSNTMIRNIIGQRKSSFDLREIMDNKKVLLVNLSKGRVGELNSKLLGMIFVMKAQVAAMSRVDQTEQERVDFTLYVDEFQNFATDSFATILSEARKYRLNLIVANQFIGQLQADVRDAVFGNVGTLLSLRVGPDDSEYMEKQFTPVFNQQDLLRLENFNAACKLMIKGVPTKPFTIVVDRPWEESGYVGYDKELANAIKELSRSKYGRERAVVEHEIEGYLGSGYGNPAGPAESEPLR